jgi:hypothetical protein
MPKQQALSTVQPRNALMPTNIGSVGFMGATLRWVGAGGLTRPRPPNPTWRIRGGGVRNSLQIEDFTF